MKALATLAWPVGPDRAVVSRNFTLSVALPLMAGGGPAVHRVRALGSLAPVPPDKGVLPWRTEPGCPYNQLSDNLKRAVIASEDDGFANHNGVELDALEKAWAKNSAKAAATVPEPKAQHQSHPRVVGGSTIAQQLARNLFTVGRTHPVSQGPGVCAHRWRWKGLLSGKRRILEILPQQRGMR